VVGALDPPAIGTRPYREQLVAAVATDVEEAAHTRLVAYQQDRFTADGNRTAIPSIA
jgi:hypothetical protein